MSGCTNAGQALARGLKLQAPRNITSLPFLYQTATLRRYHNESQYAPKEHKQSRGNASAGKPKDFRKPRAAFRPTKPETDEDFIPFEADAEGVQSVVPETPSTLTGTERKAFEKLESMAATSKNAGPKRGNGLFDSLDELLNAALSNGPQPMREEALPLEDSEAPATQQSYTITYVSDFAKSDVGKILDLLKAAKTDTEILSILEKEVFVPVSALHLDREATEEPPTAFDGSKKSRKIVMINFPKSLTHAAFTLRTDFPTSDLILSIIPKIRAMGPSVYALGASAKLYNQVIAFLYEKYMDIDSINELLGEMDREVIEPSPVTLQLLDHFDAVRQDVHRGVYGAALRSVLNTEQFKRSFDVLGRWRSRVERVLREQEIRAARKKASI